jgi:hypothetical protein
MNKLIFSLFCLPLFAATKPIMQLEQIINKTNKTILLEATFSNKKMPQQSIPFCIKLESGMTYTPKQNFLAQDNNLLSLSIKEWDKKEEQSSRLFTLCAQRLVFSSLPVLDIDIKEIYFFPVYPNNPDSPVIKLSRYAPPLSYNFMWKFPYTNPSLTLLILQDAQGEFTINVDSNLEGSSLN